MLVHCTPCGHIGTPGLWKVALLRWFIWNLSLPTDMVAKYSLHLKRVTPVLVRVIMIKYGRQFFGPIHSQAGRNWRTFTWVLYGNWDVITWVKYVSNLTSSHLQPPIRYIDIWLSLVRPLGVPCIRYYLLYHNHISNQYHTHSTLL